MVSIKEYRKATEAIVNAVKSKESIKKDAEKEIRRLKYDVYGPEIQELKSKLSKKTLYVETQLDEALAELNRNIENNRSATKEAGEYFELMRMFEEHGENGRGDTEASVYYYSDRDANGNYTSNKRKVFFEPIGTVYEDSCSIVQAFIVPNKKPINKFSLVLRGNTIFGYGRDYRRLLSLRGGYISGVHEEKCNIIISVKDAATEKELLQYFEKSTKRINNMVPKELTELAQKYQEASKLLKDPEWLKAYLEDQAEYYEKHYSRGEETPEYKEIMKRLKKLQ